MRVFDNVLEVIGNTPVVRLNRIAKGVPCTVLGKMENLNPGGSVKDRIGVYMIEKAEKAGLLKPGGTVVEATSGNTGVALAVACAVKGYRLICTMPDKMSQEKINLLRGFGARVVVTPTAVDKDDPRHYVETAKRIARETTNAVFMNQFYNPDNPEAQYHNTGPEIYEQMEGRLDVLVLSMGTGGTLTGAGRYLKEKMPDLKIVAADPEGSAYASLFRTGDVGTTNVYKVEGIGHDYQPGTADLQYLDDVITIPDRLAFNTARRLAREEGLFVGGSSGANVAAALRVAKTLPKEAVVLVILCDTGERYLSKQWNDDWMRDNQFLEEERGQTAAGLVQQRAKELEPLIAVEAETSVKEAIGLLREHDISQLPVRREGEIVGCLRERQLIDLMVHRNDLESLQAHEVMGAPLPVVPGDTPLEEIAGLLTRGDQDAVLVKRITGELVVLTTFDLIHGRP